MNCLNFKRDYLNRQVENIESSIHTREERGEIRGKKLRADCQFKMPYFKKRGILNGQAEKTESSFHTLPVFAPRSRLNFDRDRQTDRQTLRGGIKIKKYLLVENFY